MYMSILPASEETTLTTITLNPNFGDTADVIGAKLTMTNNTGNESHIYKQTAKGTSVLFNKIVPGIYTLTIEHNYYFAFSVDSVTVNNTVPVFTADLIRKGPAGGVVFYDKGSVSDGWRFLEAAPSNTEFEAKWSSSYHDIPGIRTVIGTGKQNTQKIVSDLNSKELTGTAAQLCINLNINGYSDWFLPSKDELNEMYKMRSLIGGFQNSAYWSSSQYGINLGAWYQIFGSGSQGTYSRDKTLMVRAIRAF